MKALVTIACLLVAVSACWMLKYPSGSWRYRMTITVDTPEGRKTGSAVREVTIDYHPSFGFDAGQRTSFKGDAVEVDLGRGRSLFGTLCGGRSLDNVTRVFFDSFPLPGIRINRSNWEAIKYYNSLDRSLVSLSADEYPILVTFNNIDDPSSAIEIRPDTVAKIFGDGVNLVSITIEPTSDPVTDAISRRLSWIPRYYGVGFDGSKREFLGAKNYLTNYLRSGCFSTEGYHANQR